MKTLIFTWTLFKKFPVLFISNVVSITLVGLIEMTSVFSIVPVIDTFLHPDLGGDISDVTKKFIRCMELAGVTITKINFLIILLIFIIFQSVFIIFTRYLLQQTKYSVLRNLITETYNSFFNARWHFFSNTNRGTMLNTFNREITLVGDSFESICIIFSDIFRLGFYIAVPIYISWQSTLIAIGSGLFFAAPLLLLSRINFRFGQKSTSTANKYVEVLQESFGAAKVILGYGNQYKNMEKLDKAFEQHSKAIVGFSTLRNATPKIFEPFGWLSMIFAIYIACEKFAVPVAEVAIFAYTLLRVIPLIGNIVTQKNSLSNFSPSHEQVTYMNNLAKQQVQKTGKVPFTRLGRTIELKGIQFAYPNHEPVLNNINAVIKKGKMTAFVGESGAGKSTLIDLIMGFYEPDDGIVTIDGIPLFEHDIISFRQRIGFVPQDSILFNTSIRNNLLWSKDDATENDIIEACKLANAHDFIMEMPHGYDTVVGDRGVLLSGGQRQRIALARAVLRKPELLILDEATSALDSQSELLIQEAIEEIANKTTIVAIAHRLSTIARADWIYVLENGCVVEQGTYHELISSKGKFAYMARLQGLAFNNITSKEFIVRK